MSATMRASSSSTVSTDIRTMTGHHAGLCHQTFARTGGWWAHTQPSHLGLQATAAPLSLYLAPSHTGMAGGDIVIALCGTQVLAVPGVWQQCWGVSAAIKPPRFGMAPCWGPAGDGTAWSKALVSVFR